MGEGKTHYGYRSTGFVSVVCTACWCDPVVRSMENEKSRQESKTPMTTIGGISVTIRELARLLEEFLRFRPSRRKE